MGYPEGIKKNCLPIKAKMTNNINITIFQNIFIQNNYADLVP